MLIVEESGLSSNAAARGAMLLSPMSTNTTTNHGASSTMRRERSRCFNKTTIYHSNEGADALREKLISQLNNYLPGQRTPQMRRHEEPPQPTSTNFSTTTKPSHNHNSTNSPPEKRFMGHASIQEIRQMIGR